MGARIAEAADALGSRKKAAEAAGVSDDMIYRYIRGESLPSLEAAARLAQAVGWSIDYLARGGGRSDALAGVAEGSAAYGAANGPFVHVPFYEAPAASADDGEADVEPRYAFNRDWLYARGWALRDLVFVRARGNAQAGLIDDGQLVLVNSAERDVRREGIYVLLVDGQPAIKITQIDYHGNVLLRAHNPMYREVCIPSDRIDEIVVVGRAVWTDRLL